jgi:8-oxo-dGTP diphosphatase
MDCFLCEVISGSLILREHEDSRWLKKSELDSVAWLPADIDLVKELRKYEY